MAESKFNVLVWGFRQIRSARDTVTVDDNDVPSADLKITTSNDQLQNVINYSPHLLGVGL